MRTALHADDETLYREEPSALMDEDFEVEALDDDFLDDDPDEDFGLDEPLLEEEIRRFRMDR